MRLGVKEEKVLGCYFCDKGAEPAFKNAEELKCFLKKDGTLQSIKKTELCLRHQKKVSDELKIYNRITGNFSKNS